jgi:small subunit ribosomal protein S16
VLRIRLRRVGKKKQPNYRLVVADSRSPRDGAFIETVGTYNPLTQPATITVKDERVREWIGKGAVPSDRAAKILSERGLCDPPKFTPKAKQEKPAPEVAAAEAAAPAAAAPAAEAPAVEAPVATEETSAEPTETLAEPEAAADTAEAE